MGKKRKSGFSAGLYDIQPSKQVRTLKHDDHIELRRRWRFPGAWMLIAAAVFWNVLMLFAVTSGENLTWLCLMPHISVGLVLGYYALALLFNETRVFVEGDMLRVLTGPIPLHAPREFHAYEIKGISVVDSGSTISDAPLYDLMVHTGKGEHKLLGNLNHYDDGLFLKQELAFILGLELENEDAIEKDKRR